MKIAAQARRPLSCTHSKMKFLEPRRIIVLLAFVALLDVINEANGLWPQSVKYGVAAVCLLTALLAANVELSRRFRQSQKRHNQILGRLSRATRQIPIDSVVEIDAAAALRERFPGMLIPTSSYSMRFANLLILLDVLETHRPRTIVEFGSGISTLLVGSWVKEQGHGKLISIDHDPEWIAVTQRHVNRCGLDSFVDLISAPLIRRTSLDESVNWYDLDKTRIAGLTVDLMIVDGPPQDSTPSGLGRLPALEVVAPMLAPNAVVVLDDANREGEKAIVGRWCALIPELVPQHISSMTGICLLRKRGDASHSERR